MTRAADAHRRALDAERAWQQVQDRTRSVWDDVVRQRFDDAVAAPLAPVLRRGTEAIEVLERELSRAVAILKP